MTQILILLKIETKKYNLKTYRQVK